MDKQHRILVPQSLRDLVDFDISKSYALCLEDDKIYYLLEPSMVQGQVILDVVKLDEKGRFVLPPKLFRHYKIPNDAVEFIFVQDKRVYISFDDE